MCEISEFDAVLNFSLKLLSFFRCVKLSGIFLWNFVNRLLCVFFVFR